MSQSQVSAERRGISQWGERYFAALAILLAGYAIFGKPFAYLGFPPLYLGEIVLALGLVAFFFSRCAVATLAMLPNLFLAALAGWALICTLPYIGEFGVDSLRDSVLIGYGAFAFIMTALLLEKPERLPLVTKFFAVLGVLLVLLAPILVAMSDRVLTGDWSLVAVKPGTTAVHVGAVALLTLLGLRRSSLPWLGLLFVAIAVAATQNRGGMIALLAMLTIGLVGTGKLRELIAFVAVALGVVVFASLFDLSLTTNRGREISGPQLVENFVSILDSSRGDLEVTKEWRKQWWGTIGAYTVEGPYFWTGKGFGVNLAVDDGVVSGEEDEAMLRSPHSAHFNILARTGVPGLVLWILTLGSWSIMLVMDILRARLRGDETWANFFMLIFCYELGLIIDGSFDVTLEGPMAGIWFWSLFGVGVGASMIYRAQTRRNRAAAARRIEGDSTRRHRRPTGYPPSEYSQ